MKMGIAVTAKRGLIVGARSFPSSPYDGSTLAEQLEEVEILSGQKPATALVDLGYRGRKVDPPHSPHTKIEFFKADYVRTYITFEKTQPLAC